MSKTSPQSSAKTPVVTIMGHVDHGKTTLLDKIRHSHIADKEAGGITQHIGAYQVEYQGQLITFIDTPGHAAFSKMRSRGASITDIVVLVVAADDGVKPQTKEAIKLIQENNLPLVVAINKIDVVGSSPDMVKAQLLESGIMVEGYGGNVPVVEIAAREGRNIDKLLETILLLSEIEEFKAEPNAPLQVVVIEAGMEKNQGPTVTLLVNRGTLKQGDELVLTDDGQVQAKVKRMASDTLKTVTHAVPGQPVKVLGFKSVPHAGDIFTTLGAHVSPAPTEVTIEDHPEGDTAEATEDSNIKILLIADTQGSLEAILTNLGQEVQVLAAKTGEVNESDVLMANSTNSVIVAFNARVTPSATKLAEMERVKISRYTIIYELLEDFEKQVLKFLEPTIDETETGVAKVKATFKIRQDLVAGCVITSGIIRINDRVHHRRGDRIITDARVVSLKQGKVDVESVEANHECGIVLKPQLIVAVDDILQAFTKS